MWRYDRGNTIAIDTTGGPSSCFFFFFFCFFCLFWGLCCFLLRVLRHPIASAGDTCHQQHRERPGNNNISDGGTPRSLDGTALRSGNHHGLLKPIFCICFLLVGCFLFYNPPPTPLPPTLLPSPINGRHCHCAPSCATLLRFIVELVLESVTLPWRPSISDDFCNYWPMMVAVDEPRNP